MSLDSHTVDVNLVATRLWQSAIAVVICLVVWRLIVALVDRLFARKFATRFIPRAATFGSLIKSIMAAVALVAAVLACLSIWGIDISPAIWSAGFITAGLAFGAQSVVRDVLTGLLFLFDDIYEIGDTVEIVTIVNGIITGTVESLGLRLTVVLDDKGRRVAIPNGNIVTVANASRLARSSWILMTLPLRRSIGDMSKQLVEIARSAASAENVSGDGIEVYLSDFGSDSVTFRIDIPAASVATASTRARIRERIAVAAQERGWLPGGVADPVRPESDSRKS
jgi:moderate conductance mechanosensitive channel